MKKFLILALSLSLFAPMSFAEHKKGKNKEAKESESKVLSDGKAIQAIAGSGLIVGTILGGVLYGEKLTPKLRAAIESHGRELNYGHKVKKQKKFLKISNKRQKAMQWGRRIGVAGIVTGSVLVADSFLDFIWTDKKSSKVNDANIKIIDKKIILKESKKDDDYESLVK